MVSGVIPVGKDKVIFAVDSSGTEWTLTIPANAVPANTKITITPLEKITSGGYPGTVTGGVLLEPDGLTFDENATLSIKMAKNVPSFMLTGDGKGRDLCLLGSKQNGGTVTAPIAHFSTMYFEPTDDLPSKETQDRTREGYENILKLVKELLRQPIEVIPPPTISLGCYGEDKLAQAKAYAKQVSTPESFYLQELINHGSAMALLGSKEAEQDSLKYVRRIHERLVRKADRILKESKQDPDKFLPTAQAVIGIYNGAANFGVEVPSPSEAIGPYAEKAAEQCLKEIRDKHNFKYLQGALEIGRQSALLGNKNNLERLLAALTFKVEFKLGLRQDISYDDKTLNAKWDLTGEAEIIAGTQNASLFTGEGTGEYAPLVSNHEGMSVDGPFSFNAWVTKLDPCQNEKAVIEFDRLSAESESYWSFEMPSTKTADPFVKKFSEFMFPLQNGKFVFNMPLNNGQIELCNYTVNNSTDSEGISMPMSVTIKLTHTPK